MPYYAADACPKCGAPMRYSTRDHKDRPAIPVSVCTNEQCRTAIVHR